MRDDSVASALIPAESMPLPVLEDLPPLSGRRVLVRADLNVPLRSAEDGSWMVADDFRLRASAPTLEWLLGHGASVVVCSHLGRPGGKVDSRYSMAPVRAAMAAIVPGVEVMENLRFDPGEEANDPDFVRRLVDGFDAYVDDAFGACHRSHASIVGPPALLPSAAGRLLEAEVEALERLLQHPTRPFVAIVGGAKVADKLGVLRSLAQRADRLLLGGAMCFTFLAALGHEVGASRFEPTLIDEARSLLAAYPATVLPTDFTALWPGARNGDGLVEITGIDLAPSWQGMDIGPATSATFASEISRASTVLWNGPMGVFEDPRFAAGTRRVADAIASCGGFTVVGGGDTVAALHQFGLENHISHLSSGGGATLELLEYGGPARHRSTSWQRCDACADGHHRRSASSYGALGRAKGCFRKGLQVLRG
jgi:phosphoglycerate kinase